jgi:hypothetical protein
VRTRVLTALCALGVVLFAFALTRNPRPAGRTDGAVVRQPARDAGLPRVVRHSRPSAKPSARPSEAAEYSPGRSDAQTSESTLSGGEAAGLAAPAAAARPAGTPAPVASLTHEEIAQRARQVEYEAWRRTVMLNRQVPLTARQVGDIFRIYARDSKSYDPTIPIEGETPAAAAAAATAAGTKTTEQQVLETLDQGQQVAVQQTWVDRDLWWTEIIAQLAEDFPVGGAAASASPAAAAPAADTAQPAAHQVDNLSELLGGGR